NVLTSALVAEGTEDAAAQGPEDAGQGQEGESGGDAPFAGEQRISDVDRYVGVDSVAEAFDGVAEREPADGALESAFVLRRHLGHIDAVRSGDLLVMRRFAHISQPPDCLRVRARTRFHVAQLSRTVLVRNPASGKVGVCARKI